MIDTISNDLYNETMTPERIKTIRARVVGTSYITVNNWERGKHKPTQVFVRLLTELEQTQPEVNGKD